MKTLAAITLPTGLHWQDQRSSLQATGVIRTALDGSAVVFGPVRQPRRITLVAGEDYGWFTIPQADALVALAATPGPHTLNWEGATSIVAFDFTQGAAVNLAPLYPYAPYLSGTLSLIQIEE